jgi:hypothetical protein
MISLWGDTMIVKAKIEFVQRITKGFWVPLTSFYFCNLPEEKLELGKLVLSIRVGKRRKLISGKVIHVGYESGGHNHPGYEVRRFIPNGVTPCSIKSK